MFFNCCIYILHTRRHDCTPDSLPSCVLVLLLHYFNSCFVPFVTLLYCKLCSVTPRGHWVAVLQYCVYFTHIVGPTVKLSETVVEELSSGNRFALQTLFTVDHQDSGRKLQYHGAVGGQGGCVCPAHCAAGTLASYNS